MMEYAAQISSFCGIKLLTFLNSLMVVKALGLERSFLCLWVGSRPAVRYILLETLFLKQFFLAKRDAAPIRTIIR